MRLIISIALLSAFSVSGCTEPSPSTGIDQVTLCEVKEWQTDAVRKTCKPGQKVIFLPRSFGNEQLPVVFAALNCDLRYEVALTNGAVTCIFNPRLITNAADKDSQ